MGDFMVEKGKLKIKVLKKMSTEEVFGANPVGTGCRGLWSIPSSARFLNLPKMQILYLDMLFQ